MDDLTAVRHPAREAADAAPNGFGAVVLEPSPPAVVDDFFADDPAVVTGGQTVAPTSAGAITWDELAADDPELAGFARQRWLGAWQELGGVPDGYPGARDDFHRLAFAVVAGARHQVNGKFGLRFTAGGFGTPFFGEDRQVRMVGAQLVVQDGLAARGTVPASIADAAAFVGVEPSTVAREEDSPELGDLDAALALDADVGEFLGDWFGFVTSVLEELRLTGGDGSSPADHAGRIQLWPGHFDPAVELGDADAGRRATYGGSPGDTMSPEPYLYIGPWGEVDSSSGFWGASDYPFVGGLLTYRELLGASNQRDAALDFFRRGHTLLHAS